MFELLGKFSFLGKYYPLYLTGAANTVLLAAFSVLGGVILGIFFAFMKISKFKILRFISSTYIEFIRGTPLLVQLLIVYYGLSILNVEFPDIPFLKNYLGLNFGDFMAGVITLSLNSSAYVGEIFRAGIQAVPKGQMEAARSLGMTHFMSMQYVILPQAIKNVLPALGNEFVVIIKESSIVSIIGIAELMYNADTIRSTTYMPVEPLIVVAIVYFFLTFPLSKLLSSIERRMSHSDRN